MGIKDGDGFKPRTVNPDLRGSVKSVPTLGALRNGHRHDQSAAVINMLTDKIDSAG